MSRNSRCAALYPCARVLLVRPDYVPLDSIGDDALAVIAFGATVPGAMLSLSIPQLGQTPLAEVWRAEGTIERGSHEAIVYASSGDAIVAALSCDAADVQQAAACVYDRLITFTRGAGFPHLLCVRNHISDINADANGLERYRGFCAGRHEAFARHGYAMRGDLPAASGVGMEGAGVTTYCIASRTPATAIENPRQVSAYDYPPRYGPRSPSFSRAIAIDRLLFVSGTASIVGHETRHAGDVMLQLSETLLNLELILGAARARELAVAKIYLRREADYAFVAGRLRTAWPRTKTIFLRADLCRADLLVEIEGVAVT